MHMRLLRDSESDLEQADRLLMAAYRPPSWRREVEVYLRTQPDGWFAVDDGGEIVAMAGALAYGSFCWVGLVATHPDRQREGLATRLSTHLIGWARERGCATVALDGNDNGRPVYERIGFQPVGDTLLLLAPDSLPERDRKGVHVDRVEDVQELLPLDRSVFGGDRAALLRAIVAIESPVIHAIRDGDAPAGFLFARDGLLGPGCARTPAVAEDLVRAALGDDAAGSQGDVRLLVPMECAFTSVLFELGFREQRRLTHMRLGDPMLPGQRQHLFAQVSFAAG
jgi:GNAT superfamily N-acetyltransferase